MHDENGYVDLDQAPSKKLKRNKTRELIPSTPWNILPDVMTCLILLEVKNKLLLTIGSFCPLLRRMSGICQEGLYSDPMEVSVFCTLRVMQSISRVVQTCTVPGEALFLPSFPNIKRFSLEIESVNVYLHSLRKVCDMLHMCSPRDYDRILRQFTQNKVGECLLLMGSESQKVIKRDGTDSIVNRIVVGSSVLPFLPKNVVQAATNEDVQADGGVRELKGMHDHVFEQNRTLWENGGRCHTASWRRVTYAVEDGSPFT